MKYKYIMEVLREHYDKLVEMGFNVVGVFLYGSQNYGLDYEGSDIDTKAIVLPTLEDIILCKQPISTTIEFDSGLCDIKDIRKMFECFKKQNINFIELLFTKYRVINKIYEKNFEPMLSNRELIARYNNYASINCMSGMAMEKFKAMCHPYPAVKDKIEKYGYDNKQLHHILRIKDFIVRYCHNNEPYEDILIPSDKDSLLKIKTSYVFSLEKALEIADKAVDFISRIKTSYMETNPVCINDTALEIMNKCITETIKTSIRREINN